MRFRKKPVVIEAVQYVPGVPLPEWVFGRAAGSREDAPAPRIQVSSESGAVDHLLIPTLEGTMLCLPGDWIIKGVAGELYPCKPEIFEATYEPVAADEPLTCRPDPANT